MMGYRCDYCLNWKTINEKRPVVVPLATGGPALTFCSVACAKNSGMKLPEDYSGAKETDFGPLDSKAHG